MDGDVELLKRIYDGFNARDIDGVLTVLTDDVAWANGMDGGYVHGREAVREYWTRQWSMVSPHVEPVGFQRARWLASTSRMLFKAQTVFGIGGLPCCASSLICFVPTLAFKFLVFPECWIVGRPLTKWRRY